jgi:hypothetical protein
MPGTIGELIGAYMASGTFKGLSNSSKVGYTKRLRIIREQHGHRTVAGLTKDRIKTFILDPLVDRPGAALDTLKKLRIDRRQKKSGLGPMPSLLHLSGAGRSVRSNAPPMR